MSEALAPYLAFVLSDGFHGTNPLGLSPFADGSTSANARPTRLTMLRQCLGVAESSCPLGLRRPRPSPCTPPAQKSPGPCGSGAVSAVPIINEAQLLSRKRRRPSCPPGAASPLWKPAGRWPLDAAAATRPARVALFPMAAAETHTPSTHPFNEIDIVLAQKSKGNFCFPKTKPIVLCFVSKYSYQATARSP
jgi:hypothetical protein